MACCNGLNKRTKFEVDYRKPDSIEDAMLIATQFKNCMGPEPKEIVALNSIQNKKLKCHNCGIPGHLKKDCGRPKKEYNTSKQQSSLQIKHKPVNKKGTCYNCGLDGHRAADCRRPKRKVNVITETQEVNTIHKVLVNQNGTLFTTRIWLMVNNKYTSLNALLDPGSTISAMSLTKAKELEIKMYE